LVDARTYSSIVAAEPPPSLRVIVAERTSAVLAQAGVPVAALFHRVGSVLPQEQQLLISRPDDLLADMLAQMGGARLLAGASSRWSRIIGVFSYRSFARKALKHQKLKSPLSELPLRRS
jgi:hypothetical protein